MNNKLILSEIRPSESKPDFMTLVFKQPATMQQKLRGQGDKLGFDWAKKESIESLGVKVGDQFEGQLVTTEHDEPQYEGHQPFEKTGKYYTTAVVLKWGKFKVTREGHSSLVFIELTHLKY